MVNHPKGVGRVENGQRTPRAEDEEVKRENNRRHPTLYYGDPIWCSKANVCVCEYE